MRLTDEELEQMEKAAKECQWASDPQDVLLLISEIKELKKEAEEIRQAASEECDRLDRDLSRSYENGYRYFKQRDEAVSALERYANGESDNGELARAALAKAQNGGKRSKGVLMAGMPPRGKTLYAKALAGNLENAFVWNKKDLKKSEGDGEQ